MGDDMRLLLIEDEKRLASALSFILKKNNYLVDCAYDGEEGNDLANSGIYDLVILDRMLPYKEGLEILKEMRANKIEIPVILVTAMDSVEERIKGLDCGADDYLVKPFSTDELLARIRALLRRRQEVLADSLIEEQGISFNINKGILTYHDKSINLTMKETHILELLLRNKNQVISKEQILDRVWGFDSEVDLTNIEVYLSYLRKKIKSIEVPFVIHTARGSGYFLTFDK